MAFKKYSFQSDPIFCNRLVNMVFNCIMKDRKNINCLINFSIRPWKNLTKYRNKFTIHFTSNNTYNNSHHRRDAFRLNRPGTAGLVAGAAGRLAARAGMTGRGVLFGPGAPWPLAWHCRAKIAGAAGPAPSAVSAPGRHHVSHVPRHHAWRGTGIWPRQGNRSGQKC